MSDINRMRLVTHSYAYLQGLRLVPLGVAMAFTALIVSDVWPWRGPIQLVLVLGAALAAIGAGSVAGRYYERRFGTVRQHASQQRHDVVITVALAAVIVVAAGLDAWLAPPLSVYGLAAAATMLAYWRYAWGRLQPHHGLLAGLIVAVSLAPLLTSLSSEDLFPLVLAAIGLTFVVSGLADHLFLTRTLGPAPSEVATGAA